MKHNQPGGWVRVELRAGLEDFTLSIENSGAPIRPELLARIFDRFVRGSATVDGSGLGLSITKTIVEAHGGAIVATDRPNVGTRFAIQIPRSVENGV